MSLNQIPEIDPSEPFPSDSQHRYLVADVFNGTKDAKRIVYYEESDHAFGHVLERLRLKHPEFRVVPIGGGLIDARPQDTNRILITPACHLDWQDPNPEYTAEVFERHFPGLTAIIVERGGSRR